MPIKLNGATSGYLIIDAPAVAGNSTITFPSNTTGSFVFADSSNNINLTGNLNLDSTQSTKITDPGANVMTFHTSQSERMRIDSGGNISIGTTTTNLGRLTSVFPGNSNIADYAFVGGSDNYKMIALSEDSANNIFAITNRYTSGGIISFRTGTTGTFFERMRVDPNGNLRLVNNLSVGNAAPTTSGSGITFPAVQSSSTDANTLDDYEEGTWTPTYLGTTGNPTITYGAQAGYYLKIGKFVWVGCNMFTSNLSGGTGLARIGGLPFTVENTITDLGISLGLVAFFQTPILYGGFQVNSTQINLYTGLNTDAPVSAFNNSAAPANYMRFQGCYRAAT